MNAQDIAIRDYTTTVTILESITDAIFILNSEFLIEYANRSALSTLQQPLEALIGQSMQGFIPEQPGADFHSWVTGDKQDGQGSEQDGAFGSTETELKGSNGNIPVLINMSSIPDGQGDTRYIIVTAKEIGYRKGLEKELKRRQALSVSFDRLKALGEMSVGLVHTLGQPVTSMELRLEHIKRLSQDTAIHHQIDLLRADIDQLTTIVNKVRDYALVADQREKRLLSINDSVQSSLQVLEYDLRKASISSSIDLAEDIQMVEANAPELEQVIINLITNAIDAFDSIDRTLPREILIQSSMSENKWVELSISDNAGGIPLEIREKIFEPFFSTWENDKHAGTGLSVSRSILTALGGDLRYLPRENGSKFQVRIPVRHEQEREQLFNLIELLNSDQE